MRTDRSLTILIVVYLAFVMVVPSIPATTIPEEPVIDGDARYETQEFVLTKELTFHIPELRLGQDGVHDVPSRHLTVALPPDSILTDVVTDAPSSVVDYRTTFGLTLGPQDDDHIYVSEDVRSLFVDIDIRPVIVDPITGHVEVFRQIELEVHYTIPGTKEPTIDPMAPDYDMIIITPRSYVPTYQVLSDHHNDTGIITTVIAEEDIYSGRYFPVNGSTNPARIKYFIKDAIEAWNITYVTLGGDSTEIPRVQAKIIWLFTCDLYYADIYKPGGVYADWNADGDGEYGEFTDDMANMDIRPDVHLGRLPSANIAQATTMVEKVRYYDNNTAGADWFKKLTVLTSMSEGRDYGDYLGDDIYRSDYGFEHIKLYNQKATAENFTAPQNHSVGYMAFWGHGGTASWLGDESITTADINSMNNFQKLPIISIMACECGHFDAGQDCFAETFLKSPNGGGISVLAGTQTSNAVDMYSWAGATNKYFHDSNIDHDLLRQGMMYTGAVNLFVEGQNPKGASLDFKNLAQYVFFGDPAATIGGFSSTTATMTSGDTDRSALPGENVTYTLTVRNTGGQWTELFLSTDLPDGSDWSVDLVKEYASLGPGASADIQVNVSIPQNADANETLDLMINATSAHIPNSPLTVSTTTLVLTNYTFDFEIFQNETTIGPGTEAEYELTINNTGNDLFGFGLELMDPPSDWSIAFSQDTIPLARDLSVNPTLTLAPGPNVTAGPYHMLVRCTLKGPDLVVERWVNTTVSEVHGFDIIFEATDLTVEKDEAAHFNFTAYNLGNHMDSVEYSFMNEADLPGWILKLPRDGYDVMLPFSYQNDAVTVQSTNTTLAGDYMLKLKAVLVSDGSEMEFELVTTILPEHGFALTTDTISVEGTATDTFPFEIRLMNDGNAEDTYDLELDGLPEGWTAELTPTVTVAPYGYTTIDLEVMTSGGQIEGGFHNFTVNATSRATGDLVKLHLAVDITKEYGLETGCSEPKKAVYPAQTATFKIVLRNIGNFLDAYSVTVEDKKGWTIDMTEEAKTIGPWEELNVSIGITSPAGMMVGTYTFPVKVTSITDGDISDTIDLKVDIQPVFDFELEVIGADGLLVIKAGDSEDFHFKLTNRGNTHDKYKVELLNMPPGWTYVVRTPIDLDLAENKTEDVKITVRSNEKAGEHKVEFKVSSMGDDTKYKGQNITIKVKTKGTVQDDAGLDTTMLGAIIAIIVVVIIIAILAMIKMRGGKEEAPAAPPEGQQEPPERPEQPTTEPAPGPEADTPPEAETEVPIPEENPE